MSSELLDIRGLSKRFAAVQALDGVSLSVRRGEIVALLGHNGSGKSTLVKILSGNHAPDGGEIRLGDRGDTRLHFIHQNLGLVPALTVAENFELTRRTRFPRLLAPLARRREEARIGQLMRAFGVSIDANRPVSSLSLAQRTVVAVARALDGWGDGRGNGSGDGGGKEGGHVLVLDEPTAALHGEEVETLKETVRTVAARGAGVVYISHRLREVVELADRAVVLKNGRVVAELARGGFGHDDLVQLIAGGDRRPGGKAHRAPGAAAAVLTLRGLAGTTVRGVDLDVAPGEIVGIAGLVGSGMEEFNGLVFGARPNRAGEVLAGGRAIAPGSPRAAIAGGLAFVPADRHRLGGFGAFGARENITLPALGSLTTPWGSISRRREDREALDWMRRLRVHPAGMPEHPFALFSGGNQQKLVLAKWLRTAPSVLLVDEPTQGVDAGAQAEIHMLLAEAAARGAAVVVSSSDAKELAHLCGRVVVLRDGLVAEELSGDALGEAALVGASFHDNRIGEGRTTS